MNYLLKTEPTVYSFSNLERDKTTIWDGVTNPAAVKHLREMKPGERLVIYHTGDEDVYKRQAMAPCCSFARALKSTDRQHSEPAQPQEAAGIPNQ